MLPEFNHSFLLQSQKRAESVCVDFPKSNVCTENGGSVSKPASNCMDGNKPTDHRKSSANPISNFCVDISTQDLRIPSSSEGSTYKGPPSLSCSEIRNENESINTKNVNPVSVDMVSANNFENWLDGRIINQQGEMVQVRTISTILVQSNT